MKIDNIPAVKKIISEYEALNDCLEQVTEMEDHDDAEVNLFTIEDSGHTASFTDTTSGRKALKAVMRALRSDIRAMEVEMKKL